MSAALDKAGLPGRAHWVCKIGQVEINLMPGMVVMGDRRFWLGRRVAIHGKGPMLAKWLSALEGFADAVILVPANACQQLCARLAEAARADIALVDSESRALLWRLPVVVDADPAAAMPILSGQPAKPDQLPVTRWVVATSGTTSTPKLVSHTLASLARTVAANSRSATNRWGLLYDVARFAGLQVFLQAALGGEALVFTDHEESIEGQLKWLMTHECNAISATPTLWRKMLMTNALRELRLEQITLGGEIVDQRLLNVLQETFPKAHITHVYASTEAGVGFAVHDGKAGFPATYLTDGVQGNTLSVAEDGCLTIANATKVQEYVGTDASLYSGEEKWINTGDLIERVGDRMYFRGRLNGSINVGGNKVIPEEVEAVILEYPPVAAALVRGRSSSIAGALVEATIVGRPGTNTDGLAAEVKAHCRARLASYKVPALVRVVSSLETTSAGKTARQ